jgi:hypothetical protein
LSSGVSVVFVDAEARKPCLTEIEDMMLNNR